MATTDDDDIYHDENGQDRDLLDDMADRLEEADRPCADCLTVHDDDESCCFECPICSASLVWNDRQTVLHCAGCDYRREP